MAGGCGRLLRVEHPVAVDEVQGERREEAELVGLGQVLVDVDASGDEVVDGAGGPASSQATRLVNDRLTTSDEIPSAVMAMKETTASWVMVTAAPSVQFVPSSE